MEYSISNHSLQLVLSDIGAELQSIEKDGREYLWNGDPQYWPERSPILFPYVGRFTEGKYRLGGREYEMEIHGFAKKYPYRVAEQKEDSITFELRDHTETYQIYPYHFILQVTYRLQDNTIAITYRVFNASPDTMYFGIGGHPGFRVPLEDNRILRLYHKMFDEDAIVFRNMADEVTLKSEKGMRRVTVSYPNMPYLGLWHAPKTEAPYLCIEPWTSLPSRQNIVEEFRYKSDLIRLAPEKQYRNTWNITIC